jgi:hypothetical protein
MSVRGSSRILVQQAEGLKRLAALLRNVILCVPAVMALVLAAPPAHADVWDSQAQWSTASNPAGAWSYGRKWAAESDGFDLMGYRWQNYSAGGTGWYLGGTQWAPSVMDVSYMWPNGNENGIPATRWTCPSDGYYDLGATYMYGYNSVGAVSLSGAVLWSGPLTGTSDTLEVALTGIFVQAGQHVDFTTQWSGVGSYNNWTWVDASVTTAPEPATLVLLGLGALALVRKRGKRHTP